MIEDILAEYAAEGFVISNTFQMSEGDWIKGKTGWDVYIRNLHNTRSAHGHGTTLAEALQDAFAKAMTGPTYTRPQRDATTAIGATPPPKAPILSDAAFEASEDIF